MMWKDWNCLQNIVTRVSTLLKNYFFAKICHILFEWPLRINLSTLTLVDLIDPSQILKDIESIKKGKVYSVFQEFRQAKSANGGSILSLSQFLILPQLPQKNKAHFKSGQSWLKNNHIAT